MFDPSAERVLVLVVRNPAALGGVREARLPKGHIEPGESRAEAAVREVFEETGLFGVEVLADLGHQMVEFGHQDRLVVRDESYFLMAVQSQQVWGEPEPKFERVWLSWDEALSRLTYEPEREWVRRSRRAWEGTRT